MKWFNCSKIYLLAELAHFFLTTRLLYVFKLSLEGSTEPPEPPLDPPLTSYVLKRRSESRWICRSSLIATFYSAEWLLSRSFMQ